jgi:hypothetical protein
MEQGIYHAVFIANEFQVDRIRASCKLYGNHMSELEVLASEDIITKNDPSRIQEMQSLKRQAKEEGLYNHHNGWRKYLMSTKTGTNMLRAAAHLRKRLSLFTKPPWKR